MICLVRKRIVSLTLSKLIPIKTLLFSSSANLSVPTAEFLSTQNYISPETALIVSSTIPHLKNPLRADSVLSSLKQIGFTGPQINQMIYEFPRILSMNPDPLKAKLNVFHGNGFSTRDIIHIVSSTPQILRSISGNRMVSSITALKAVMGSTDAVCGLLKRHPWFLSRDLENTTIPNFKFLKNHCKLSSSRVLDFMVLFPRFFILSPYIVAKGAKRVDDMGLDWSPQMYIYAVRVVCSISDESFELKMSLFRGLGFSDHDVLKIFNRRPHVFSYSEKNLRETLEVLFRSGRADSSDALNSPKLLTYSVEKRIKPRLEILDILEEKGLLSKKLNLPSFMSLTNKEFLKRYVLCNSNALGEDIVIGIIKKLGGKS